MDTTTTKTLVGAMSLSDDGMLASVLARAVAAVGEPGAGIDEDYRQRLIDALGGEEDDTAAEVLIRGLRAAYPSVEDGEEDPRDLFECFRSEFEAVDPDGYAKMIEVVTDISDLCPELIDLVESKPACLAGQVEWWAEWGGRYHNAECEIRKALVRGGLESRECRYDPTGDFEVCVEKRGRGRPALPPEEKSKSRTVTFYLTPQAEAALAARQAGYPKGRSDTLRYALATLDLLVAAAMPTLTMDEWRFLLFHSRGIVPFGEFSENTGDYVGGLEIAEGNPEVIRLSLTDAVEHLAQANGFDSNALLVRVEGMSPASLVALYDLAKRLWARVDLATVRGADDDFDEAVAALVPADCIAV